MMDMHQMMDESMEMMQMMMEQIFERQEMLMQNGKISYLALARLMRQGIFEKVLKEGHHE